MRELVSFVGDSKKYYVKNFFDYKKLNNVVVNDVLEICLIDDDGIEQLVRFRVNRNQYLGQKWHIVHGVVMNSVIHAEVSFQINMSERESKICIYACAPSIL